MDSKKQAGVAIIISDKVGFKPNLGKRDKEGHSMLIKEIIHQKEIMLTNPHPMLVHPTSLNKHYCS
jgi:hypothetical protein